MRELHWHPNADEWQYVLEGKVSVTMFGSGGRYRTETLDTGDVGYIPQGYGHSIENVGATKCRVLIGFNSGVYENIDLSEWIAGNPARRAGHQLQQAGGPVREVPQEGRVHPAKEGMRNPHATSLCCGQHQHGCGGNHGAASIATAKRFWDHP